MVRAFWIGAEEDWANVFICEYIFYHEYGLQVSQIIGNPLLYFVVL
ncbi:hypothetical protein LG329_16055 [Virgibacillus necropolis]